MNKYRKLALAVFMLPVFASAAVACSCMSVSPCEAYGNASVAFVGQVTKTSIEPANGQAPSNAISTTFTNSRPVTLFKVEKTFGRALSETVQIYGESTTCDLPFKTGERYLVYAYQDAKTKNLSTNICSGTALVADAQTHLTYLAGAVNSSGGTVSGQIWREMNGKSQAIAGAEIVFVNGARTFRGKSDAVGEFTVTGLPQGRYKVHTNPRTNQSRLDVMAEEQRSEWEIDIPGHGCVTTWFAAGPEGEIGGTVTDEAGILPADLELQLIPVDAQAGEGAGKSVMLKKSARFNFSFLSPGRYYLGFNLKNGPSLLSPYQEFYYPGVAERAKARIITLAEGQKITNLFMPRPLRLGEWMVEGNAVWPDGKPYVEHCIQLANPRSGYREGNCVSPDARGHFRIKAIEGQTYHLSAMMQPGSFALIGSKPLTVTAGKDSTAVRLVVTMP
ncbi:MAG TPA: hypothetical protein VJT15_18010 [Pyrinomonadaceae bacterium]|nr:hypothetical protein [Pyrinomonadaceae bacterium]